MAKQKMNVKLLRKVAAHVLEEPRRLRMSIFGKKTLAGYEARKDTPPCGTVGCIAGWSRILTEKDPFRGCRTLSFTDSHNNGQAVLGLSGEQAQRLFYTDSWPRNFRRSHDAARTAKTRAKVTAARIDHFIKTNGAE